MPSSYEGNNIESYSLVSGSYFILITASVMIPKIPSDPIKISLIFGPLDFLGESFYSTVIIPVGVIMVMLTTISSIFPYRFFFIPEALVEIQPPSVENSTESGS